MGSPASSVGDPSSPADPLTAERKGSEGVQLRLGDHVPDFTSYSTQGRLQFSSWSRGRWSILLSHPAAFTPVCTTEMSQLAKALEVLRPMGYQVATFTISNIKDLLEWKRDIEQHSSRPVSWPMIADQTLEISVKLGLIDAKLQNEADARMLATRSVVIINPDGVIKFISRYPGVVGQNFDEIVRVCDALLVTARDEVATPASWPNSHGTLLIDGKDMWGSVFILTSISDQEASHRFPDHVNLEMPSGRNYMRLTLPQQRLRGWQRLALAVCNLCSPHTPWGVAAAVRKYTQAASSTGARPLWVWRAVQAGKALPLPEAAAANRISESSIQHSLRVGDRVPEFAAQTSQGYMASFHRWTADKWTLLFSHPAAFTPVCTTEVGTLALVYNSLRAKGFQVAVLSADALEDIMAWRKDISFHFNNEVNLSFPMIADPTLKISQKLGMVDPSMRRTDNAPISARSAFIIGPDKRLCLSVDYPGTVGRNIHEILRACEAVRLCSCRKGIATPANWPNSYADVDIQRTSMKSAVFLMPEAAAEWNETANGSPIYELALPSGRKYMCLTHAFAGSGFCDADFKNPCPTCVSGSYRSRQSSN